MSEGGPQPPKLLSTDPWVRRLVPFASSLALHLIVIGILLAAYSGAREIHRMIVEEQQVIVPDATLVNGGNPGGIPNPGLGGDPNKSAASDLAPDTSVTNNFSPAARIRMNQALMGKASNGDTDSMIGLGASSTYGAKGPAANGEGGVGALPFGIPGGGGGTAPRSPFMGISGNAKKVVYICDASGSMLPRMDSLKSELRKSIDILQPIQAFNVMFFQDEKVLACSKSQLLMATPDNKSKAYNFLTTVSSGGGTDPVPSLTLAFHQHPQLIYLLTDGDFPNNDAVIRAIRALNRQKSVKINTIAFISSSDQEAVKGFIATLKQIAQENGGQFKLVLEEQLQ